MEYLVIFLNYDGTELYRTTVQEGGTAVYEGPMPQRKDMEFSGWNKSLKDIRDNLLVTATFEKVKKGSLKVGVMTFVENEKDVHILDQAVITNEDLHKDVDTEIDR